MIRIKIIQLRDAHTKFRNLYGSDADNLLMHCLMMREVTVTAEIFEIRTSTEVTFTRSRDRLPHWAIELLEHESSERLVWEYYREIVIQDRSGWSYYSDFEFVEEKFDKLIAPSLWNHCDPVWDDNSAYFWRLREFRSSEDRSYRFYARKIDIDPRSFRRATSEINAERQIAKKRRAQWPEIALAVMEVVRNAGNANLSQKETYNHAMDILDNKGAKYSGRTQFLRFLGYFIRRVRGGYIILPGEPGSLPNWDDVIRIEVCARVLAGERDAKAIVKAVKQIANFDVTSPLSFELSAFTARAIQVANS